MKLRGHKLTASLLLLGIALYIALIAVPAATSNLMVGYQGEFVPDRLVVTGVFEDSPAHRAGLTEGDTVFTQGGREMSVWHRLYTTDFGAYLEQRAALADGYDISTGSAQLRLEPRPLSAGEFVIYYGIRAFLILFLTVLSLVIVFSRTEERTAFLTFVCFCFAMLWFASDQPYWPRFNSPFILEVTRSHAGLMQLVEIFSLQMVMATLLHISLVFPRQRAALSNHPWLPVLAYFAALIFPLAILVGAEGTLLDRSLRVLSSRLMVNSVLLLLITGLMVDSYVRCRDPLPREQARWIVTAMGIIAVSSLALWNIPMLLTGKALIPSYNWLLLTFLLLPIALTMSMTNHELFGMRGMIRGRIRLLETRLGREKRLVGMRDVSIREMQQEIRQLQQTLDEYGELERVDSSGLGVAMEKLERQYPELIEIRQTRLIGASPLWATVFEQVAVGARGPDPVLIVGESGTGKTDAAWAIHRLGERRQAVYKQVSCAQFEHADPAFALGRLFGIGTGHGLPNVTKEGQPGLLEECDGGCLLMDDFDRLPLNVQDLFLYPLEGKAFDPGVGAGPSRNVSVKLIFATNQDPEQLVAEGRLRGDVLARLVTRVEIPPLRERPEDIPLLVDNFTRELSTELGQEFSVSNRALNILCAAAYESGNARQLKAELRQAASKALLEDDRVLRAGYLSQRLRSDVGPMQAKLDTVQRPVSNGAKENVVLDALRRRAFQIHLAEADLGYSHKSKTLSNHLRGMCIQALTDTDWDPAAAAQALAGEGDPKVVTKLKRKIERLQSGIQEHVANQTSEKLFNNLPASYHQALHRTIARYRG